MAVFSTIKKSQLEGAKRLDAEYYQPGYLEVRKSLANSTALIDVSKKITDFGAYSQMNFVEYSDSGVRFLRNQDVGEFFLQDDDPVFVPEQTYEKLSLKLEEYDIVTPRVGTLGNAAVVFRDQLPASANQNLAQIKPDRQKINPLYLAVFLSGRFGQAQFDWLATGNVQPWLNLSQINSIKIFTPSLDIQNNIAQLATKALDVYKESKSLYTQAETLLFGELGLKGFKADEDLYSIVNFSDIKSVNRMDAEYFQPKYEKLISALKKQKARSLTDVLENVPAKFNPLTQPDKGFKYVELSNIGSSIGIIDGYTETSGKEAPSRAKRVLKKGDVIVSTVEGSLGKVALVSKEQEGCLASTGFFQFRSENLLPEVLLVIAKSFIFHNQLEQRCAGTILTAVPKYSIKDILVPILPKVTQEKIAKLVRGSHEARKKAKELLEKAKHQVEELVENN